MTDLTDEQIDAVLELGGQLYPDIADQVEPVAKAHGLPVSELLRRVGDICQDDADVYAEKGE